MENVSNDLNLDGFSNQLPLSKLDFKQFGVEKLTKQQQAEQ